MSATGAGSSAAAEAALKPRRSVLYMPGANERALEKAKTLPADALILDLEDAVAPDAKVAARERVCSAVTGGGYGLREVTIRVNSAGTQWHADDIVAVSAAGPAAVVVPKVDSAAAVVEIEKALEAAGAPEHTKIWALLETPIAMLRAHEIASASERLTVLVMGTNDLAKELNAEHVPGRAPLLTGLGLSVIAARAAGKVIIDGVYNDVNDDAGFAEVCLQGRQMGFDGKTLIHPKQVEPANRIWAPTEDGLAEAHAILEAWDAALAEGKGVATVNGKMIENLHVDNARRLIAQNEAIAALTTE